MERQRARIGVLAGMALAVVFLIVVGYLLVRPADSSYRALVAVWLWALPAFGVFGSAGWLLGKGVDAVGEMPRRRGSTAHGGARASGSEPPPSLGRSSPSPCPPPPSFPGKGPGGGVR